MTITTRFDLDFMRLDPGGDVLESHNHVMIFFNKLT